MLNNNDQRWAFYHPVRVIYTSLFDYLPTIRPGAKVLLVTTAGFTRRGLTDQIVKLMTGCQLKIYDQVLPNPDIDDLDSAIGKLENTGFDFILAVGGGSVIDAAKCFAVSLNSQYERPLSEMLRNGCSNDSNKRIPVIAVPTTSGTGSEVTQYATVWDLTNGLKYSLSGEHVFPEIAILDPLLSQTLPGRETLYTSLDAISHALEALWNINVNPFSELYSVKSLELALEALPLVLVSPENIQARAMMQQASLFAGYAISIAKTAISHAISYPLTARFGVPHGLACGFSLAAVIELQISEKHIAEKYHQLLIDVQKLIVSFDLAGEISTYANEEQIHSLLPEMFDPSRIRNFNVDADQALVSRILKASLTRTS